MFIRALVTINLISFLMGIPTHIPYEMPKDHGIYATTMYIDRTEVYGMGTPTIEDDEGLIVLIDGAGFVWEWKQYPEDYFVGDYVSVLMDDNGTPESIYDDIIIKIRYSGFYR